MISLGKESEAWIFPPTHCPKSDSVIAKLAFPWIPRSLKPDTRTQGLGLPPNSQHLAYSALKDARSSRGTRVMSSTSFLDKCPPVQVVPCISSSWMSREVEGQSPEASQDTGWGLRALAFPSSRARSHHNHSRRRQISTIWKPVALFLTIFRFENQPICSYFRQPNPSVMDAEGSFSRGFIAWHMGDYEDTNQRNSKRAVLLRQSQVALPRVSRPPKLSKLPKEQEVQSFTFRNHRTSQAVLTCALENAT